MKEKWRLIDLAVADAATQMATDEAIASARNLGETPNTVRLYRWKPSAVSVGYFQSVAKEVDLDAASAQGIDVIRRITGGGAVYHDYDGEITYSLVAPESDPLMPKDILESYKLVCGCVVLGLRRMGVESEFKPVNDITAGGRKVSGNAQTRRHGVVLQHGTILLGCDPKKIFSVLKVSGTKLSDKAIASAEERVTSVRKILGRDVGFPEARDALVAGFEEGLGVELVPGNLTATELRLAAEYRVKYASRGWVHQR